MSEASRKRQKKWKRIERSSSSKGVLISARARFARAFLVVSCIILIGMFFYGASRLGNRVKKAPASGQHTTQVTLSKDVIANGDFENTEKPIWYALKNIQWGGFEIAKEKLSDGKENQFAKVSAQVSQPPMAIKVFGAVQEIDLSKGLPKTWEFDMRVAKEQALCDKQYAQVVAIFWRPKEGSAASENPENNVQLRTILHGVKTQPYQMGNARFHMHPPYEEKNGWRHYSLPLKQWFAEAYPELDFSNGRIRLLMEARYDSMPQTAPAGAVALEVDYDNSNFVWEEKNS